MVGGLSKAAVLSSLWTENIRVHVRMQCTVFLSSIVVHWGESEARSRQVIFVRPRLEWCCVFATGKKTVFKISMFLLVFVYGLFLRQYVLIVSHKNGCVYNVTFISNNTTNQQFTKCKNWLLGLYITFLKCSVYNFSFTDKIPDQCRLLFQSRWIFVQKADPLLVFLNVNCTINSRVIFNSYAK